jgi:hypothetical protein
LNESESLEGKLLNPAPKSGNPENEFFKNKICIIHP